MWTVLGDFAYRLIHVCCLMQSWICILIGVQGSSDALFCDLPISWSHVSSFNHSFSSFHPNSTQSWSKPGFSLESQAGSGCCVVVPVHPSHLLQLARRTFRWCWSWLFMKWDFFKYVYSNPTPSTSPQTYFVECVPHCLHALAVQIGSTCQAIDTYCL